MEWRPTLVRQGSCIVNLNNSSDNTIMVITVNAINTIHSQSFRVPGSDAMESVLLPQI
jgi:hypothetical protein